MNSPKLVQHMKRFQLFAVLCNSHIICFLHPELDCPFSQLFVFCLLWSINAVEDGLHCL